MNILLTGEPHVGKSTLLASLVSEFEHRQGFVTNEVVTNGHRTGFELESANGDRAMLADVNSDSQTRVSRYGVNLDILESFIDRLPEAKEGTLLYIDEIGQMELFSGKFKRLVEVYLDMPNPFVGTLSSVYADDFTDALRTRGDVEIIQVSIANRDTLSARIATKLINTP